jgi:hypothetical protein
MKANRTQVRMINTKAHASVDYCIGLVLILSPWIFDYRPWQRAHLIAGGVGVLGCALALLTRFEWGVFKVIPLRAHLIMDFISGIFLAFSPWLFHFKGQVFKPHLVFGLTAAVVAVITDRVLLEQVKPAERAETVGDPDHPQRTERKINSGS